jgi:hypothetical protein
MFEPGYHRSPSGTLVVAIRADDGCRVFYEVGAYALVISPEGEHFRVRVGGGEVSLAFLPPVVDLEFIAARRRPLNLTDRTLLWTDANGEVSLDERTEDA